MLRPSIWIPACILALLLVVGQTIEAQDSVRALWASAQGLLDTALKPVGISFFCHGSSRALSRPESGGDAEIPLSNHHPITHTLFIRLMLQVSEWTGNRDYTILAYAVTQMVFLSAVYACTVRALHRISAPKRLIVLSLLHFALNPYISVFFHD